MKELYRCNLRQKMVYYTEPSGKSSLESLEKGPLKKYWPGDWINNLSITIYRGLTSTNQIKPY